VLWRWLGLAVAVLLAAVAVTYVLWPAPPLEPTAYRYAVQGGFAAFDQHLEIDADSGEWTYRDATTAGRQAQGRLQAGQVSSLRHLAQEVDWPHLPPRLVTQPPPPDELLRTAEVATGGQTYRVTVGTLSSIPSTLIDFFSFLEGVRRQADASLPPRFHLVSEGSVLYLVGAPGQKDPLLDLKQLSDTFRPQGADSEFGVGKQGFGPTALSPGGTRAAWATTGSHPLLGILNLARPSPVPLDLYYGGTVQALSWSPEEAYLAVQVQSAAEGSVLRAYSVSRKAALPFPGREQFPPSSYSLTIQGWLEPEALAFSARPLPGGQPLETADWIWDLKEGRVRARQ